MKQYYICKPGGTQEGPYPEDMVRACYSQGVLPADSLIWYEGASEWMPIQIVFPAPLSAPLSSPSCQMPPPPPPPTPPPLAQSMPPSPQEEASYYVIQPGMQQQGPYTRSSIVNAYFQGSYTKSTKVWGPSTDDWIPITDMLPKATSSEQDSFSASETNLVEEKQWTPLTAFTSCMKRYFRFRGRASRSEYWFFVLASCILYLLIGILATGLAIGTELDFLDALAHNILRAFLAIPTVSVAVRRCHDTGHNGWFTLIPIYGWIIPFLPSQNEDNPYGVAPLPPA